MRWKYVKLEEICDTLKTGKTPPSKEPRYFNGEIDWYTPGDIGNQKKLSSSNRTITTLALSDKKALLYPSSSLLITCIGNIGNVGIIKKEASSNQQITALKPNKEVDINYLYYWFIRNKKILENKANNAVVPILNNAQLKRIKFGYPPLFIQKQIAEILDTADALRQKTQEQLEALDELVQAVFLEMFGDTANNSEKWALRSLKEVLSSIDNGWSPNCDPQPRSSKNEWAILKLGSISSRFFNPDENKKLPEEVEIKKKITPHKGDLLFSRKNTKELVGAAAFIFETEKKLLLPDTIFKLNYNNTKVKGEYLWYLINDINFRKKIQSLASGSAGSMPNISKSKLLDLKIPVPGLDIQNHFARAINNLYSQKSQLKQSLQQSEDLFQALLQEVFQ